MSLPMARTNPCADHGCSACCRDTEMPLVEEDIARLVAIGHDRDAFAFRNPEGWMQLKTVEPAEGDTAEGKPCFFLKEAKCSVYADRPAGCRIYPLVLNEQARLLRDEDCPHRQEFPMDIAAKRRILKITGTLQKESRDAKRR